MTHHKVIATGRKARKTTLAFLLAAAAAVPSAPFLAAQEASAQADSPAALREQINQLDQKIRILERKAELKEEAAAKSDAKNAPAVSIGAKGFSITSADKAYSLKIGALIQADARFYADDGNAADSFLLRRIRLPITIAAGKNVSFFIQPEFAQADGAAGGNTQLTDAWAEWRLNPEFGVKFGKYHGPVALETPNNRHFIEASFTNQLVATRDIGLEAGGSFAKRRFSYRAGLYNGSPNNSWAETGNLADGDFTLGGRLTFRPIVSDAKDKTVTELGLSVGASYGHEAGTGNNGRIRSYGQQNILAHTYATGDHLRLGPAVEFYHGPFSAIAELLYESWDNNDGAFDNLGWRLTGGWVITGENARGRVAPTRDWGALEVVARVSGIEADRDVGRNIKALSYGLGLAWYLTNNLSLRADVVYTDFGSGVALEDELALFARVQINF